MFGRLMHVMGDRPHIIEEFRVDRPTMIFSPNFFPNQLCAYFLDSCGKGESIVFEHAITQTLVRCPIFVRGRRGGGKPTFIDPTAVKTIGVDIIRMELEPAPRL